MAEIPFSEFLLAYAGRKVGRELSDKESKDIAELTSRQEVKDYLSSQSEPVEKKTKPKRSSAKKAKSEVVKDDGEE